MKLLNNPQGFAANKGKYKYFPCEPQMKKIKIGGKTLLLDVNALTLFDIPKEMLETLDTDTIGVREKPIAEIPMGDFQHKMIVFQATYACNLKCRYCFVLHHYLNHENTLTYEEAIEAIDRFQVPQMRLPNGKIKKNDYNVGFFGGEPLLNWEMIYKVAEEVKRRAAHFGVGRQMHITTNATLVTEEIAKYCAASGFTFIVSLDGPQHIHDECRPYADDGRGTWEDTMRGLGFLADAFAKAEKHNPITLRGTFDKEGTTLIESLKFLNKLMYDGLAGHVSVEPSSLGEGCSTGESAFEKLTAAELKAKFEPQYEEAARWFLNEIKEGRKPSFHHFEVPMQRIYDMEPGFSECGAGKGYVSVGPGGGLCACHREHGTELGHMSTGIDPTRQAPWLDNRFFVRTTCKTCWRRHICGGGCRANSLLIKKHISVPSSVECMFRDLHIKWSCWLLANTTADEKDLYSKVSRKPLFQKQAPPQQQAPPQTNASLLTVAKQTEKPETPQKDCQSGCQVVCQSVCQYPKELDEVSPLPSPPPVTSDYEECPCEFCQSDKELVDKVKKKQGT